MKHHSECRFLKASKGVPVECEHGYDVFPICDPCNCTDSIPSIDIEMTSTPIIPRRRRMVSRQLYPYYKGLKTEGEIQAFFDGQEDRERNGARLAHLSIEERVAYSMGLYND